MISIGNLDLSEAFIGNTEVKSAYLGNVLIWPLSGPEPTSDALCFWTDGEDQILSFYNPSEPTSTDIVLEYSYDGEHWSNWDFLNTTLTVNSNKVFIRGNNSTINSSNKENEAFRFKFSNPDVPVNSSGSVMSLLNTDTLSQYGFAYLFTETPIKTAPELPSKTVTTGCYYGMFDGCKNLVKAPVLPASKFAKDCYSRMFRNCSKLNYVRCLAKGDPSNSCDYWLYGVARDGDFYGYGVTLWMRTYNGIPNGWCWHKI